MFISYNWLRELTQTKLSPAELRERLTMVGLAIDAVSELNGDFVLDVEVPSNRPDCLSHIGIAREVAVIESGKLTIPKGTPAPVSGHAARITSVEILDTSLCPRYAARVVKGVRIAPSPEWLRKRLEEIGQRPINNVADITNYVLHELGQPLHAFDFSKLIQQRIVVRRAERGEKLRTLDGVERSLTEDMLVIADAVNPVALAGIMGGEGSEISETTIDVLLESAYFNPESVRRTARQLGMDTEASRRFERGADRANVISAQTRCIELICEIAGGQATEDYIDVNPNPVAPTEVMFSPERVEKLTSVQTSTGEMLRILTALGFTTRSQMNSGSPLSFTVPSWRVDVSREEDLVEEIARHVGYDRIGSSLPPATMAGEYQPSEMKRRALRRALTAQGFDEAINFSFIEGGAEETFSLVPSFAAAVGQANFIELRNPIIDEARVMRPTLLRGLLDSLRHNLNHGIRDVRLFEMGRVFAGAAKGELPQERECLSLVATGALTEEGRALATVESDFFALKGAVESAIDAMRLEPLRFDEAEVKHLRDGQSAAIKMADATVVGSIGRLADSVAMAYKFRQPVFVAELDFTMLLAATERKVHYHPLPRFPAVMRDVTLLVSRAVTLNDLLQLVETRRPADYQGTRLVGTYEGSNIPDDKRSITLRIEYRSDERTLRDEEVEERHRSLVDSLVQELDAELH
jgi:phenylalanyl-tRNA synthetase beta chain